MNLSQRAEELIRRALEAGEFDDLPGRGQPLDLDAYFAASEEDRAAWAVLKNAGYVPEEVTLWREIDALRQAEARAPEGEARAALRRRREEQKVALELRLAPRRAQRRGR